MNKQAVTSSCYPVWFRKDLSRAEAQAYWQGPHGQIANKNPAIHEYLQHHFSLGDHGFWPAPKGVGVAIPSDWRMDGMTEVRVGNVMTALWVRIFQMKANLLDEQNLFDRVLAKMSTRGGGHWWTGPYLPEIGFRTVLFLRARHEVRGALFQRFIEEILAPALMAVGVQELRTHVFKPGSRFMHWSPNVAHDEPANRRYDCALVIGVRSRADFNNLLTSGMVQATQPAQLGHCVAMHAYAVDHTYPLVLNRVPQAGCCPLLEPAP